MVIPKIPPGFDNIITLEKRLKSEPEKYWVRRGQIRALQLFKLMSQRVPAYKDFLKKNKVNPVTIKTIGDFKNIPPIDKKNYLTAYPLESMCWDGDLRGKRWTFSTNSGSTGEPFYFPREKEQDLQYAATAELYLRNNFDIHKKSTLYLDCFAMGAWIGGLFTYEAIRIVAESGKYPLSVYTPGIFKDEILKSVSRLGNKFDQIVIGGYPPFVKDILDDGEKHGINWKKYNIGIIFSAEGFTEEFREYIYRVSGIKDYFKGSLNHYGTADMGTMAHETPITILVRKLINNNNELTLTLFPEKDRLPTLVQYMPELFYFEEVNNTLFCSAYSGLPFVRYNLKDYGGILEFKEVSKRLGSVGINLDKECEKYKFVVWNLPFVYLYERKDFTVKLYGANIFPDTIRHALQQKVFDKNLTQKFTMSIKFDKHQNQYFELNIELKSGIKKSDNLLRSIRSEVVKYLLKENSEYTSNYRSLPKRQIPKIVLWQYDDPTFFKPGGKHKWVDKS